MEISILSLELFLILIPGGIASIMFYKLSEFNKVDNKFYKFLINSLLFNLINYLLIYLIYMVFQGIFCIFCNNSFCKLIHKPIGYYISILIDVKNINALYFVLFYVFTLIMAILLSVLAVYIENKKSINRLFNKVFKITNKYGDESLVEYYLNSPDIRTINVVLVNENLMYRGSILSFNKNNNTLELILSEVEIFDINAKKLGSSDLVYLSKKENNIIIENIT